MARNVSWGQEGGTTTALSTIDGFLKEDYVLQNIQDTVNMATFLLSKMGKQATTAGRRFRFPLRLGVGEGQGNRKERTTLPAAGFGSYDEAFGNTIFQYGALDISGPAIAATEGNRATYTQALKQAIKDCRDGYRLETYRQAWGDGTGTIATVVGTGSGKTITVRAPYGLTYDENALSDEVKTRMFRKNMPLLFVTAGTATYVTAVNGDGTITVNDTVSYTAGERIVRGDTTLLNNDGNEYLGVSAVMQATGTYLGVPRAGEPGWQANVIELAGATPSEDALQNAWDTSEIQGDGMSAPDMLLSEHAARRVYINLLAAKKQYVQPTVLEGGFSALNYNGVNWVVDKLAPPQRVYYLRSADWTWFVMKDIGWADEDGKVLKWAGADSYQAFLRAYRQIACTHPANQTVLTGWVAGGATEPES